MRGALLLMLLSGCTRSTSGDSLVVVTVDSAQPIDGVSLHAAATAGGVTKVIDIAGPLSFPPTHSFGIRLPRSISGELTLQVDARDAALTTLASGGATVTLSPGKRVDVSLSLGTVEPDLLPPGDGGADLLPPGDLSPPSDLSQPADMMAPAPLLTAQPIWIGAGGSASQRLNLSAGGFDGTGNVSAPSGAQLGGGFFSYQSY